MSAIRRKQALLADAMPPKKQPPKIVGRLGCRPRCELSSRGSDPAASPPRRPIDYDPEKKFSLMDLVGIKLFLEDELKTEVDVTTRDSLHPRLKDSIQQSAIRIF